MKKERESSKNDSKSGWEFCVFIALWYGILIIQLILDGLGIPRELFIIPVNVFLFICCFSTCVSAAHALFLKRKK